ncbi:hypothetical protein GCM10009122_32040 [Fulvivirga kasyanovii]|jgi:hypothetical protein|nr:DUF3347 domain-containing protein [Cyclobacterium marinum]|tara:strand:- start:375 stop:902 length:528 start_codon:yes stop_codon:yes gene_type:complete
MKNVMRKKAVLMMALAFVTFGALAQHDHAGHGKQSGGQQMDPMFKDEAMSKAYGHYIHLKEALVASQPDEAKGAADKLQKSLASLENTKSAQAEAGKVASASTLDEQRKAFAVLSNEMTTLVKASTLSMGEIYLEYCPMANGNTGAFWLSNEKEIKNPYFGDKMLKCGSVKETIN